MRTNIWHYKRNNKSDTFLRVGGSAGARRIYEKEFSWRQEEEMARKMLKATTFKIDFVKV